MTSTISSIFRKTFLLTAIILVGFGINAVPSTAQSEFETFSKSATIIDVNGDGCVGGEGDQIRYEITISPNIDFFQAIYFDVVDPNTTIIDGPVANPPVDNDTSDTSSINLEFTGFQGSPQTFIYTVIIDMEATSYTNQGTLTDLQAPPSFEVLSDDPTTAASPDPTIAASSGCATYIALASFEVESTVRGNQINWTTAAEIDNAGFNLYRGASSNGSWTQLNEMIIPSLGNPLAEQSYRFDDFNGTDSSIYLLEDVDLNGTRTRHLQPMDTSALQSTQTLYQQYLPFMQ